MTEEEKKNEQEVNRMYFEELDNECYIDLAEEIELPEIAISYGTHEYQTKNGKREYATPLITYGNIGIVQAQPKAGKSFFMSLLSSVFLSKTGKNAYGGKIKGHSRGGCVLHVDTEQGKWHCQKMFRRAINMNEGSIQECYHTYALRRVGYKTKLEFLDWKIKQLHEEGNKIDLILIDGVADLCADVNDNVSTRVLTDKLMEWSAVYNCAILTVIHTNFGSKKATGHLGSHLQKKVETLINIERVEDSQEVDVQCVMSRNKSFDNFKFRIDAYGYPRVEDFNLDKTF
tara:strand:- start:1162 stop:2022 length:861 start_codon:yes stop_codon:yes gene_type:complete